MVDILAELEAEEAAAAPYDASSPDDVNKARAKAGRRNSKRRTVIKALMQHRDGREWIYDLLQDCSMFGDPIVPGDPHLTYANIGMSNFGKRIWMDVEAAAPDECALMMKEARKRK